MQVSPITHRSLDQLEGELVSSSQRINASEYEFLVLVREYEIRQGWRAWGFNNCAEWLNMRCGISLGTAREKVRVAMHLLDLPLCSKAFAGGKLSYSKARAMTRIVNPRNEVALVDYALSATASQVEDHCRQMRNVQRHKSTRDTNRVHKGRYLSRTLHGDGSMSITVDLTQEAGELVMKAIELAMLTDHREGADCTDESGSDTYFQKQADALVQIAQGFLAGGSDRTTSTADHYQVMVHVDEPAFLNDPAGESAKSDLPIESVRRLTCDASIISVTEDKQGNPLNVGRKHRVVSPALRRALLGRDKCCRYPGCAHDRWLDAHHVMHWADGGETSLANTMLLCSRHHRLLHEGGYTIHKNFEGRWYFQTSNGKVIPEAPAYKVGLDDQLEDVLDKLLDDASRDGSQNGFLIDPEDRGRVTEPVALYSIG